MTKTDKVVLWGCLAFLLLGGLCLCCLGGVVYLPFKGLVGGGAMAKAKSFLRQHPMVIERIGSTPKFGAIPSGSVSENNGVGQAHLELSIEGAKGSGKATVSLTKQKGKEWVVTGAELMMGDEVIRLLEPRPDGGGKKTLESEPVSV